MRIFRRWLSVSLTVESSTKKFTATIGNSTIEFPIIDDFVILNPSSTIGPYCSASKQQATVDDVVITTTP